MRSINLALLAVLTASVGIASAQTNNAQKIYPTPASRNEGSDAWFREGALAAANNGANKAKAKNIILFVGDGMSLPTVTAARIYAGQQRGESGEENRLSWENFPHTALSKTYNTNSQTPDSAGTMTAMITGVKTKIGFVGIGPEVDRGDCTSSQKNKLVSLLSLAERAGLSTGIVTTTRLTHATPAATYAHSPDRDWERDTQLPEKAVQAGCADIARQFVEFNEGNGIEVAMGGGRRMFSPVDVVDPENDALPSERLDGRNLIAEWSSKNPQGRYVWNNKQLAEAVSAKAPRILGLFENDHMQYEADRANDIGGEPSLAEMTEAAIKTLRQNKNGFFLMVEAGRIDHAHHSSNAKRALVDTVAMADAVAKAAELTSDKDTLILVTADHSHVMSFAGYPVRGNAILGKVVGGSGEGVTKEYASDATGLPYTTLSYANGPGYHGATDQQAEGPKTFPHLVSGAQSADGRSNLMDVDTEHLDYLQESTMPLSSETHGGDDVGIWAQGPGASAVRGSVEQNVIFHILLQSNPRLRSYMCKNVGCEKGVPIKRP
jgi:alkaline phosphatase